MILALMSFTLAAIAMRVCVVIMRVGLAPIWVVLFSRVSARERKRERDGWDSKTIVRNKKRHRRRALPCSGNRWIYYRSNVEHWTCDRHGGWVTDVLKDKVTFGIIILDVVSYARQNRRPTIIACVWLSWAHQTCIRRVIGGATYVRDPRVQCNTIYIYTRVVIARLCEVKGRNWQQDIIESCASVCVLFVSLRACVWRLLMMMPVVSRASGLLCSYWEAQRCISTDGKLVWYTSEKKKKKKVFFLRIRSKKKKRYDMIMNSHEGEEVRLILCIGTRVCVCICVCMQILRVGAWGKSFPAASVLFYWLASGAVLACASFRDSCFRSRSRRAAWLFIRLDCCRKVLDTRTCSWARATSALLSGMVNPRTRLL